ncbi:MAG: sulfotransferase [Rhodospirillaceae bacterium]|nr:MAG: sulfotransferase [Rhodospirillaceae bacterium]
MDRIDRLMRRAQDVVSLEDFGDESFREGLRILVNAADAEGRLSERGREAFDAQLVELLTCRLQVEDWYRRHPEIDDQEIVAPLIGLGLPRTGSTALSGMLGEDPAVRFIRNWESLAPCPPPETATEHSDPRIAQAEQKMLWRDKMFPRMKMMVPGNATSPTECQSYMGYDFKSQLFQAMAQVPSYSDWLNHKADLVPTYRYVKRVLKLLQWRCPPRRWRLKNPSHIVFIDALAKVFPDARYWMTHRDVASVIPSAADLYFELVSAFSDDVDKAYLGELNTSTWELGMRRLIAFRDSGDDARFFDIHFEPFQKDPFPILQRLYDFLGEEFTAEARTRMEAWRRDTPREMHGSHRYDPADFGLDPAVLRERFRFYSERFNVLVAT